MIKVTNQTNLYGLLDDFITKHSSRAFDRSNFFVILSYNIGSKQLI